MLVRDIGKTNCLIEIPQDIDLRFKEFVQPVLTENGTMGGDSFACDQSDFYVETSGDGQKAWYVFDGKFNGQEWQVNGVKLDTWYWLSWYNPQPIKISKVGVTNAAGQYSILAWKLQGSNDNSTWTDLTTGTNENVSANTTWYMEIPEEKQGFYKYYRIYCQPRVTTALMIRELTITAVEPTIVLKAGSNYCHPVGKDTNDKPVFEKITTTRDISSSWNTSLLATNGQRVLFLADSTSFDGDPQFITVVGSTDGVPTTNNYNRAYDYTNNFMYYRSGSVGWVMANTYSLPIALITSTNGYITSIDQVFNDFGIIGSTLFALPGVKGFNPNGFENGAYANRERILGNVAIYTNTSYVSESAFGFNGTQVARWSNGYEEVDELPDVTTVKAFRRFYVRPENKIYVTNNNTAWIQETSVFAGYLTMDSTAPYNITSLTVNPVRTKNDSKPYILTKGDKKYLFARSKKKYYKYIYENWTQPVLTSNTSSTLMTVSATNEGHQPAWKAFDEDNTNTGWNTYDGTTTATLSVKFSDKLAISKIEILPMYHNNSWKATSVKINNIVKNFDGNNGVTFEYENLLITNSLDFIATGVGWTGLRDIKITAQKQVVVEGSVEDYDYTEYEELKFY